MKMFRSYLLLSLLSVTALKAQIPNSGFENWSGGDPTGWATNNAAAYNLICVLQSNDAAAGSSSAKLTVASYNGIDMGPLLSTSFRVTEKILNISGYYKFNSLQNDILSIAVTVSKNGTVIGEGMLDITTASTAYKSFKVGLNYAIDNTPDECKIIFVIGSKDNQTSAHLGSFALVDNLSYNNLGSSDVADALSVPAKFNLQQNYPNPFNPETKIKYSLSKGNYVTIKVYDILGNEISTLVNRFRNAGEYEVEFNAAGLPSGVYIYKMVAGNIMLSRKMQLIK